MMFFEFPVPYTATLMFNGKPRNYNVLGTLTAELEALSMEDLTPVASWHSMDFDQTFSQGPAGECYWNNGRFLSPIVVAAFLDNEVEFKPLRPGDVRQTMLTRDRVFTFDDRFFFNSQPGGFEHDLFQEVLANDSWRPDNLPNGELVEDTFARKSSFARDFLKSLVLVDGNLFQVTDEPVIGCILDHENETVSIHIRTADKFHEDWEIFRLNRLDDAIAYAEERWPDSRVHLIGGDFTLHDERHLSFDDEGYSLICSGRSLIDSSIPSLANLPKEIGMNIVRLNQILPHFDEGQTIIPDIDRLEIIAERLASLKPALKQEGQRRLEAAIERWNLRPNTQMLALR